MFSLDSFEARLRETGVFPPPPHKVLVACSGGLDSVFLLHALWALRERMGLTLEVLTCDHGLRPESAAEAEEVRHLAWSLGLPCHLRPLRAARRRQPGESVEMCARRLRREAFLTVAREAGAQTVALGHHLDDQAETVLLRLCRGSSPEGAAGILPVSVQDGIRFVRPLLGLRRETLRAQLCAWGRPWREDPSNQDPAHTRNRIRHRVLPALRREINPRASEHLAAFADQMRGLNDWAEAETLRAMENAVKNGALQLAPWRALHPVLGGRVLVRVLTNWGATPGGLTQPGIHKLVSWLSQPRTESKTLCLAGLRLHCGGDRLRPAGKEPELPGEEELRPGFPRDWAALDRILSCEPCRGFRPELSAQTDWRGELHAFCRPGPLRVRALRPGDRYQPHGLRGSAKCSDLLGGAKIPAPLRKHWPVLLCGTEIVWVPGFRVAETWRASAGQESLWLRFSAPYTPST